MKLITYICFLFIMTLNTFAQDEHILDILSMTNEAIRIDSDLTFKQAIHGTKAPKEIIDSLSLVTVQYYDFAGELKQGQIVIHKELKEDILAIFDIIKKSKFPVGSCIPINKFDWDDDLSMEANNSSGFNYRFIANTDRLSQHSYGRAFDLNPVQNPVIYSDGKISPPGSMYNTAQPGTLYPEHPIVIEFKKRGWTWGGEWQTLKDNHHFEKRAK